MRQAGKQQDGRCIGLGEIRAGIDAVDEEIVRLIAARARLVDRAAKLKKNEAGVRDPGRVEQVIKGIRQHAERAGLLPDIAERIYRTIIGCFVEKELDEFRKSKDMYDAEARPRRDSRARAGYQSLNITKTARAMRENPTR